MRWRALRLGKAEHKHFKALAQSADRRAFAPETVPPAGRRTVESLNLPADVTGRRWHLLAWNAVCPQKSLSHPKKGRLRPEYASFQANEDPALKLVIHTPVFLRYIARRLKVVVREPIAGRAVFIRVLLNRRTEA